MFDRTYINKLFAIYPTIYSLLRDSDDHKMARYFLLSYLDELVRILNADKNTLQPLEWALQRSCLLTFRGCISVRSERLSGFSMIELLWMLAHEKYDQLPGNLCDGFFEELIHIFYGMRGQSGIYDKEPYPDYMHREGREAARIRSDQLDMLARTCSSFMKRYSTGLDDTVKTIRGDNRRRILDFFNASEGDWNDYRWHLEHVIRDAGTLGNIIRLTPPEKEAIERAREIGLPFGVTPFYASLMDYEPDRTRDHAVRAQVIPPTDYVELMAGHQGDRECSCDFMMERDTSPEDLITRRYPHIVIMKPYNTCAQVCVYCQRNWEISDVLAADALASDDAIKAATDWIESRPAVNEILLTGGDPLIMEDRALDRILSGLAGIGHVERIRIGSRTPVVMPQRITDELIQTVSAYHVPGRREIVLVTHFEHPYEITPEAMAAVQKFRKCGMSVYNQAVFTIENSRRFELVALRKLLRLIGVDPYYTFNTKGKEETKSYRVPMARLQQEVNEEARLMAGTVRTDEPVYNVPRLGKNYVRAQQHHSLISILPDGRRVYEFHPWEKNLSLAGVFIDTDVSIYHYLQELKRRGENPEDYRTIWYYF